MAKYPRIVEATVMTTVAIKLGRPGGRRYGNPTEIKFITIRIQISFQSFFTAISILRNDTVELPEAVACE